MLNKECQIPDRFNCHAWVLQRKESTSTMVCAEPKKVTSNDTYDAQYYAMAIINRFTSTDLQIVTAGCRMQLRVIKKRIYLSSHSLNINCKIPVAKGSFLVFLSHVSQAL